MIDFFPTLSTEELNPWIWLSMSTSDGQVCRCRYVYYNSKPLLVGTRDEYRITRVAKLLQRLRPGDGDTMEFARTAETEYAVRILGEDQKGGSLVLRSDGRWAEVRLGRSL
jgi:hypothetical protein